MLLPINYIEQQALYSKAPTGLYGWGAWGTEPSHQGVYIDVTELGVVVFVASHQAWTCYFAVHPSQVLTDVQELLVELDLLDVITH